MRPAVVTGATGWLGSRLLEAIFDGLPDGPEGLGGEPRRVVALAETDEAARALSERWPGLVAVSADLRQPGVAAQLFAGAPDATVFHCAGVIHPRRARDWDAVNVDGTRNLLSEALRGGAERFVHVSSNSAVGCNAARGDRFTEASPCDPQFGYGRSKWRAEDLVSAHASRLETVIVRPPWFYGPNQPERQVLFFQLVKDGRAPLIAGGTNQRSMVYVDNLCQGLLLAEREAAAASQTYWIADERPYPMCEIVDTIESVLKDDFGYAVSGRRLRLPALVPRLARGADVVLQGAGLYHAKVHVLGEMDRNIACSVEKARRELEYHPQISLREGMRRSLEDLHRRGMRLQ